MGDYFFPIGNVSCIVWRFHKPVIFCIPVSHDIKFIFEMFNGIFMFCATVREIHKGTIRIIRTKNMIIADQGTTIINNNIFARLGTIDTIIIGNVIFFIDHDILI